MAQIKRWYVGELEKETDDNKYYRRVLFTGSHLQLVVMSLKPLEEIGTETHDDVDQFIRIESGHGLTVLNGHTYELKEGDAILILAGVEHNVINNDHTHLLKLYTVYGPPEHPPKTLELNHP